MKCAPILLAALLAAPVAAIAQTSAQPVQPGYACAPAGVAPCPPSGFVPYGPSIPTTTTPSASTHVQSTTLAASLVVNAAAAHLASLEVSADSTLSAAAWWLLVFDAASAPADGAVTPSKCYAFPAGTTSANYGFSSPPAFATGIVLAVSTTGCLTQTGSAHAFLAGDYQ